MRKYCKSNRSRRRGLRALLGIGVYFAGLAPAGYAAPESPALRPGENRCFGIGGPAHVRLSPAPLPACRRLRIRFTLRFSGPSEGAGLVLLPRESPGIPAKFAWQEPNLPKAFAVGFDVSDPPTKNPFDANGNIYRRPQHQVSLHWNGRERANQLSAVAFDDGKPHPIEILLDYTAGGALVTVRIDGKAVYDRRFVIGPAPYSASPVFGFTPKKGRGRGSCRFTWEGISAGPPVNLEEWPRPQRIPVFHDAILTARRRTHTAVVSLPPPGRPVRRIILAYSLGVPPMGIDPWDRVLSIYAWDKADRRIEIVRGITSFGRPCTWQADVTDYQSILRGHRKMAVSIDTWVKGWKVAISLDYYWGPPQWEAFRVTPIWSGDWEYGNPEHPLALHFPTRRLRLAADTRRAVIRVLATGHGMLPNTANAGEFFPAWRRLIVNGRVFKNLLWRTDCWLNPCRPQGGTWKYDRAGWCPGAVVRPWDVDISAILPPNRRLDVAYRPQQYINRNAGKGSRASHRVAVQLIEYRRSQRHASP